jgi:hypothetical protein
MNSTLDDSIRSALAAIVAESPDLGPVPTDHDVQLRRALERPRHPRRRFALVAAALCVTAGLGALALVVRRNPGTEPVPAPAPAVADSVNSVSVGYLSVPTMDGGAFVFDGDELTMGSAVHDPSTALPQDTTNDVSVIYVGREQFGALEILPMGTEIDWKPTGANTEIVFTVTSVRSYDFNIDPATTTTNGLIIVIDTASPDSGQRIVITATQATDPTSTDANAT